MRKKLGLFWFAAALLGAALIFAGCETEADTETKYVAGEMIYLDKVVATEALLRPELLKDGDLAIGFNGANISLLADLEIPDGKLVYILNGATLKTDGAGKGLKVKGIVYVGVGGTLDASAGNVIVEEGGNISVLGVRTGVTASDVVPGTLVIKAAADVSYDPTASPVVTALGSNDVRILGVLQYATGATAFGSTTALSTPFGYVGNGGTLDISAVAVTGSTPSTLVAAIPQGKNLIATAAADEAAATTTLSIPANANITALATDTLEAVTTLTVNGTFTTDAGTLEAVTALTVNGTLTASAATGATAGIAITVGAGGKATLGGTIAVLKASSVAAGGELTTGTVTAFGTTPAATLTAAAGSTVNGILFPAEATITALGTNAVTISALTIPATKSLTIPAGATLTVAAAGTLDLAGTLVVDAAGTLDLAGTLVVDAAGTVALNGGLVIDGTGAAVTGAVNATLTTGASATVTAANSGVVNIFYAVSGTDIPATAVTVSKTYKWNADANGHSSNAQAAGWKMQT